MGLTRSIPIVIPGVTDPVGRGYVKSLAHPGGNVTGFALMELSVIGKMLQILKEIAPQISRVTMIYNPDNPAATMYGAALEAAARHRADNRACTWGWGHRARRRGCGGALQRRRVCRSGCHSLCADRADSG